MPFSETQQKKDISLGYVGEIAAQNCPWREVLHLAIPLFYERGNIIPHTSSGGFYYLTKGEVVVSYYSAEGIERLALFVKPDCIFNEARSVSSFNPICHFRCVTDTEVFLFNKNLLADEHFIITYPHLIANIMSSMGTKMLIHYAYLAEMGVGTPTMLLARFIIEAYKQNKHEHVFPLNMTQQDIASLFGIHRTTLARAIQQLQRRGAIDLFTSKKVIINNINILHEIGNI